MFRSRTPALPLIKIDDAHWQVERSDGSEPLAYTISASPGLILDTTGYQFETPSGLADTAPNAIQIVVGKDRFYGAAWQPKVQRYTLDAATLEPLYGSPPFAGFSAGQTVLVGIGHMVGGAGGQQLQFVVLWAGMIHVR